MSKNSPLNASAEIAEYLRNSKKIAKQHEVLKSITETKLSEILASQTHLRDIPFDVTLEEVDEQISLIRGQSITVFVTREALPPFKIVIPQSGTTVRDLKRAIERTYRLNQRRYLRRACQSKLPTEVRQEAQEGADRTQISWRYIWRTYMLAYGGIRLADDNHLVASYGIGNRDELRFVKRKRDKCSKH
ncbi:U11/U12 small nuclear ribonucleoprotein 25 kDa protein-like isoform X1 [Phlebotomus papatasi]|uniref:U11/U12 small nuclear ribonucleoprotein 25 kDa protein-like isoform X1 n=1 Tax=Phlebotomus papatasi TaxID=29031 RepID=UPI0024838338|nr:U11/U12 small nuclear ribonucleoprotein 25 kDa protein-like isoform X1 [Phlebotomus papatasi]